MDGSCRPNQPCPAVEAIDARDRVVRLFGGARGTLPKGHIMVHAATMMCRSVGSAGGARTAAWCASPAFGVFLARLCMPEVLFGGNDIGVITIY